MNHNVTLGNSLISGIGPSLTFNGSNAYLEVIGLKEILANIDFTITGWIGNIQSGRYPNAIFVSRTWEDDNDGTNNDDQTFLMTVCSNLINEGYQIIAGIATDWRNYNEYKSIPSNPFHFAIVRKNNVVMLAINGVFSSQTFISNKTVFSQSTMKHFYVGYKPNTSNYKYLLGNVDDLCIIADKALWTENFTPPITYLPDKI